MRTRRIAILLLAMGLAGCDSPTATRPTYAYDPTSLSNGLVYRWTSGSKIHVFGASDAGNPAELDAAITHAIAAWNDVPLFAEFELVRVSEIGRANIVVYDRAATNPLLPGSCFFDPRGSGYTYFCRDDQGVETLKLANGNPSAARVLISVDRGAVGTDADYGAIVSHELGHALGLGGHSLDQGDVMYGAPKVSAPSRRDRQTLLYVLGATASFVFFQDHRQR